MGFDIKWEGSPPAGIPYGHVLGVDTQNGELYISNSQKGAWIKIGPSGGLPNQLQYNDSGIFGGTSGITFSDPLSFTPSKLLIIGDLTTSGQYNIIETHASFAVAADFYTHADAGFRAPYVTFYKSRGTRDAPTAITYTGYELDSIGGINFGGYDGTKYYAGAAAIYTQTDENWGPDNHGAHLSIYGTNPGGHTQQIAQFGGVDANNTPPFGNIIFYRPLTFGGNGRGFVGLFPLDNTPVSLRVRIADDSADAPIEASIYLVNGTDTGISRIGPASAALGNGTASDKSGKLSLSHINVSGLQVFANNASAVTGGLSAGDLYRTGADPDPVCVVH